MAGITISHAVDRYLRARKPMLALQTCRNIRCQLESFARIAGPSLPVDRVTVAHVDKWMTSKNRAPSSIRGNLGILRVWFDWMVQRRIVRRNPTHGYLRPKVPRRIPRELSDEEVRAIYAVLPDARAHLAISFMVSEGLRVAEVAALDVDDVDTSQRLVHIVKGKGGHERYVALSEDTLSLLRRYVAEHPRRPGQPLVCSYRDEATGVTAHYLSQLVSRWMKESGVKLGPRDGKSAHALRHTAAGTWLDEGADPRDVQEALGHADLGTTWIYTKRRRAISKQRDFIGRHSYLVA